MRIKSMFSRYTKYPTINSRRITRSKFNEKVKIDFKHSVYKLFLLKQKTAHPLERSGVINYSFSVNLPSGKRL